jgi:3-oxoadipate enol-lactonase
MADRKFITVNGVTLHYKREGRADDKPLVFLNSLGTDMRIWDAVVPLLSDRYSIIRYDQRGHGLSDSPPGPYTLRQHSRDLAGLLEALPIHGVTLIGVSVGGMIAMDYALTYPQQVETLVLMDTAAKIGTADYWQQRIEALRTGGLLPLAAGILARWFAPGFQAQSPADYQGYYNMLTRTPLDGYIATCEAIRAADLREAVTAIQARTLVLCGAEDGATPPELVAELADSLPQARFDLIDGAGHLPSVEQPAITAEKIRKFSSEDT